MIDFLNENSGAISGLTTLALLILTAFYAWTTHKLFKEAERTRLSGGEPRVVAYLRINEVHPNITQMHIANLAGAAAVGVTARLDRKTEWPKEFYFEDSKILRDLSYMRPHEVLKFDLGDGPDLFKEGEPARFRAIIDYKSLDGRVFNFDEELHVESVDGHSSFRIYTLDDVARRLEEISKSLTSIIGSRRLRVDAFGSEDRQQEREAQEQWRREQTARAKGAAAEDLNPAGKAAKNIGQRIVGAIFRRPMSK